MTATLEELVAQLPLADKAKLVTGRDAWSTQPMAKIGLAAMFLSDGPSGVRGLAFDERVPSLNLPSASALSSSWDLAIAERYGAVAAGEARRKGIHVILGPTINLHRSPLGGRNFEAFSEDPVLTGALAAAYVRGVQACGVGATPKHYVANDFETERWCVDVTVDERTLRELYLLAFEPSVVDAGTWLVMSSYNAINGATASENELLSEPLNGEWGFDGVVVSDWTAVRTIESARHPQDLAMPGPEGAWGDALVTAVERGEVDEAAIDRKVLRLLKLASRVGALDGYASPAAEPPDEAAGRAFARESSAEGMVLVRNQDALPLDISSIRRVAVIGENASTARTQGGGSSEVFPPYVVSPLDGIRAALGDQVQVEHKLGATAEDRFAPFDTALMTNPVTGETGARVVYLDADGVEVKVEDRSASAFVDFGGWEAIAGLSAVHISTTLAPDATETMEVGFAYPGNGKLFVDERQVLDECIPSAGIDQIDTFFNPDSCAVAIDVEAGVPVQLRLEFVPGETVDGVDGSFSVILGRNPRQFDADTLIAEAVEAARAADAVVVVVGTNGRVECEGYDRSDLLLPGHQDRLVSALAVANPRTVVVVNSGAPVEMPWRDQVAAVLLTWFGGQEYGNALADVLLGSVEPGGRLPTTWPATLADAPVSNVTPVDHGLTYDEGIHIGYRAWLKSDRSPAYPFGFGLGYTTWQLGQAECTASVVGEEGVVVEIDVRNTGDRSGKQVVQVYASRETTAVERPARWLVGHAVVRADAGSIQRVRVQVPRRAFAHWEAGWQYEPGAFELHVGTSVIDISSTVVVEVQDVAR